MSQPLLSIPIVIEWTFLSPGCAELVGGDGPASDIHIRVSNQSDALDLESHPEKWVKRPGEPYYDRRAVDAGQ